MTATVRIGISGWRYAPWRGVFYPRTLRQDDELAYASRRVQTIEINGSFYSLQPPQRWAAWYDETPAGFVFSVKGSRYITHLRRLREVERPLANFFAQGLFNLREKLGPILWQFPPNFRFDAERLEAFLALLPRDTGEALALARRRDARMSGRARLAIDAVRPLRHAFEVRHPSFEDPSFAALLARHNAAIVVADTAGKWPFIDADTADFRYLRLHGDKLLYASGYGEAALARWAARIRAWAGGARGIYCYFDNDVKVKAPRDARRLMEMLGLQPVASCPWRASPSRSVGGRRPRARTGPARAAPRSPAPALR